jgi:hypothetical protein
VLVRPNGNEVKETRYHSGFVIPEGAAPLPFVIPLTSTGHTISKLWMGMMRKKIIDEGLNKGSVYSSYCYYYRLRTKKFSNQSGDWWQWVITDECAAPTVEDLDRGAALQKAFIAGEKEAESHAAPAEETSNDMGRPS